MSFELKAKVEQHTKILKDIQDVSVLVRNENRAFSGEEKAKIEALTADESLVRSEIDTLKLLSKVDSLGEIENSIKQVQPTVQRGLTPDNERNILRSWLLNKSECLVDDEVKALAASAQFNLNSENLPIARSVTNTTVAAMRNLGTIGAIEEILKNYAGVRQVCNVIQKQKGSNHNIPVVNDTANMAAETAELSGPANVTLSVTNVAIGIRTFTSGVMPISIESIQDSEFDLVQVVKDNLATRLARRVNSNASVSATFQGLTTAVSQTALAFTAATPTYANLLNMFGALDMGHQAGASWMFNTTMFIRLLSILDANGLPLWNPTTALNGTPGQLFGKPFTINDDLPSTNILYGNMKKYNLIEVGSPEIIVAKERYRFDSNSIGIMISHRLGGGYAGNGICRFVGA